jgi:hypothetical protein
MTEVDAFFAEIRSLPRIIKAANADPAWIWHVTKFERDIEEISRRSSDGPEWLDLHDGVLAIIRKDIALSVKLNSIVGLFIATRDKVRTVN